MVMCEECKENESVVVWTKYNKKPLHLCIDCYRELGALYYNVNGKVASIDGT